VLQPTHLASFPFSRLDLGTQKINFCELNNRKDSAILNNFSISNTQEQGLVKNLLAQALAQRIIEAAQNGGKFKVTFPRHLTMGRSKSYPLR